MDSERTIGGASSTQPRQWLSAEQAPMPRTQQRSARGRFMCGQSLVEFALVLPMFLFLTCAIIDFSRAYYSQMTVQNALREAGRYAATGQCSAPPSGCLTDSKGNVLSRIGSIQQMAQQMAPGFDFSSMTVSSGGVSGNAGAPGAVVTLTITENIPLLTGPIASMFFAGSGNYNFTASVTFKNEPY